MKSKYFTPELARFLFDKGLLTIAEKRHEQDEDYFEMTPPMWDLIDAFEWKNTPEGLEFWDKLNDEYDNK